MIYQKTTIKELPFAPPMLATLTKNYFSDPAWIYERKLDGMRCLLYKQNGEVTIWSRNKIKQNNVFPELVTALTKYKSDFILDCEVVSFQGTKTSFEKLARRLHVSNPNQSLMKEVPISAYIFDILHLNGYDLTHLSLLDRKKILRENFQFKKPFKYLNFRKQFGEKYLKYACQHGWEGIIAKEINSKYIHKRSHSWLKFKCDMGQEFVIGGYTAPQGSRVKFGALLIGYYANGKFKYAGKVGTGFDTGTLILLHDKMKNLHRSTSPFTDYDLSAKSVTWLKPNLVAQVEYTEWTKDGRLRHPRFLGLRFDKKPKQITREQ